MCKPGVAYKHRQWAAGVGQPYYLPRAVPSTVEAPNESVRVLRTSNKTERSDAR